MPRRNKKVKEQEILDLLERIHSKRVSLFYCSLLRKKEIKALDSTTNRYISYKTSDGWFIDIWLLKDNKFLVASVSSPDYRSSDHSYIHSGGRAMKRIREIKLSPEELLIWKDARAPDVSSVWIQQQK